MAPFNVFSGELEDAEAGGSRWRYARVGDAIGAARIGATVYELGEGARTFPYHFHYGVEEWLIVLDGRPTIRTPGGDRQLRRGDAICFPSGPAGAHAVRGPGSIMILSANREPSISIYPDSDKIGVRPGAPDDTLNFLRRDAVDYWEGE